MNRHGVFLARVAAAFALTVLSAVGGTLNVSINTSAVAGTPLKVVFDLTANTLNLNELDILNFSAPASTLGSPETTGGLVAGDIILGLNPAPFTSIQTGAFFNELIVNLTPVRNSVTFGLSYSQNAPAGGTLPDEIAFFLLNSSYNPLFPTSDPFGTDSLFVIDLKGNSTSPNIYSPAAQTTSGNVQITVPGPQGAIPEPSTLVIVGFALAGIGSRKYFWRR
jgi:hypothetical protein